MSRKNLTASSEWIFVMGFASTYLVNLSTATSRCVKAPRAFLRGPTMSRPQTMNSQVKGMV